MESILVFVAGAPESHPILPSDLDFVYEKHKGTDLVWLRNNIAAEIRITQEIEPHTFRDIRNHFSKQMVDVFLVPAENRRKKLLLADMDATIVVGETLDDLAAHAGLKDEIAAITACAMRGELDFQEALTARVGMLKGLPVSTLQTTLDQMEFNQGAQDAVRILGQLGTHCVLVSGGFTFFTSAIASQCSFHNNHGNVLGIADEKLDGTVIPPILDKNAKLEFLKSYAGNMGIPLAETMAIGDGANDIPMLTAAGLGIGYRPKPLVKEHVQNYILYSDLMSLLYIQGYTWQDIQSHT